MPKDKKDKIIFAGVIFLAFLFANILSNDNVKDFFNKNDDEIVMTDQEQEKIDEEYSKEENIDDLSINDKKSVYFWRNNKFWCLRHKGWR